MHLMVLLYNYQCSTVGINQILNTFMSKIEGFYTYNITETANEVFHNEQVFYMYSRTAFRANEVEVVNDQQVFRQSQNAVLSK